MPRPASFTVPCCLLLLLAGGCATRTDIIRPQAVNAPILDYPPEAILQRQSGIMQVVLHVAEDGSTGAFKITHSTGVEVLDRAGMEFVQQLEFLPAVIRGRKQPCWAEQKVIFSLKEAPLDPVAWRDATRAVLHDLQRAGPEQQEALQQRLYEQCTDYISSVITLPDVLMNRLALGLVAAPVREEWGPYEDTFPLSFLMFADFAARLPDSPFRDGALRQLRQAVEVDIIRIDQRPAKAREPELAGLRSALVAYLARLDQSNE